MSKFVSDAPVRSALVWVAELSAVLSAAGFITSAAVNAILFRRLGLNYLQIASPSDVVMGGLDYAFSGAVFAGLAALGVCAAWLTTRLPLWMRVIISGLLALVLVSLLISAFTPIGFISPANFLLLITSPFWAGLARPLFCRAGGKVREERIIWPALLNVVWAAAIIATIALNVVWSRETSRSERLYYAPGPLSISDDTMDERDCPWSFVEWIGAQYAVINCNGRLWVVASETLQATLGVRRPGEGRDLLRVEVIDPNELWESRDRRLNEAE